MSIRRSGALGSMTLLAAVVALSGCESKATRERLAQLTTVSAEKDSLLALTSENTRLMVDIGNQLAKVKSLRKPMSAVVSPESPLAASVGFRDSLKAKIQEVVDRVNQAETRLASSQRRIRSLAAQSDSLKAQFAMAEQAMTDLKTTMENQRTTIASLEEQMNALRTENSELVVRNTALTDTLQHVTTVNHTVYYVIGTKQELKERGVVVEEGSKFLVFGGKTLEPARNLDPSAFTATDRRQLSELPLPSTDKWYHIVSRQNLESLATPATKDGKVKGSLQIAEPERFWAPSRFLILVEG